MLEAATELRDVLGFDRVVFAAVEEKRVRFLTAAPPLPRLPRPAPLSRFADLEEAALHGGVVPMRTTTAGYVGGTESGLVVPWAVGVDATGLAMLVGRGGDRRGDRRMLEAIGRQSALTMRMLAEREALAARVRDLEQTAGAFRALVGATSDPVKLIDLDGRIHAWNPACEDLYGMPEGEALGKVLPHVAPERRLSLIASLRQAAARGEIVEVETTAMRGDGSRLATVNTLVPLRDTDGLSFGLVTIVRRIDADSRLEGLQGDFVSLVSQELKNPLTALIGYAQLLGRPEIANDPTKRARTVKGLETRAQQMALVIDDLLQASRIERGALRLDLAPVDLPGLVTEAVGRFGQYQSRHRFVIDADTRMPAVSGDARRLEQLVTNLLSNTVKFAPGSPEVRVGLVRDDDDAVLTVADRGVGIPRELRGRVFERFYRIPAQDGRLAAGAGLGLYLVKVIAEAHGGTVSVDSREGVGSVFTVRLPLERKQ